MKISKYSFVLNIKSDFFVYNTLSNVLIQIDERSFNVLYEKQRNNSCIEKADIEDNELLEELIFRRIVVENDRDEFLVYKAMVNGVRNSKDSMHLTIAPTMDCCFSCEYCFEKKSVSYMSDNTMNSIIKYVNCLSDIQNLSLTWFGGEPLMASDKMLEFYRRFRPTFKGNFSSNIITTAYHIDKDVIDILKEIEVSSMQITFDGNRENHNRIKYTNNCNDVFTKILHNIDLIVKYAPEIKIIIRVNITKQNMSDYVELYQMFLRKYVGKNIAITPAIVMDRGDHVDFCTSKLFSKSEFVDFTINLWKEYGIATSWMNYPNHFISECAIRNGNATTVDAEGYIYKCWEVIGNKKRAIGKLEDGNLVEINQTEMLRNLFGADPLEDKRCSACSYLK